MFMTVRALSQLMSSQSKLYARLASRCQCLDQRAIVVLLSMTDQAPANALKAVPRHLARIVHADVAAHIRWRLLHADCLCSAAAHGCWNCSLTLRLLLRHS